MSAICLCLSAPTVDAMLADLERNRAWAGMVEVRADALRDGEEAMRGLCGRLVDEGLPFLWTVRHASEGGAFAGTEAERERILRLGDEGRASWVDVELRSPLGRVFRPRRAGLVLSAHDFAATPADPAAIIREMEALAPAVAKVACTPKGTADLLRILGLYREPRPVPLLAIAMGEWGEASRLLPAAKGLPWTYGAPEGGAGTAPGQYTARQLAELYRVQACGPGTRLLAVIGDPVAHSLSPFLHNSLYAARGLDALYCRVHVDDPAAFLGIADLFGLAGASVTVPHKEAAARLAPEGHWLRNLGAANTLRRGRGGWEVENTDIAAALGCLKERLAGRSRPRVLLLGAGGVARGLAFGMRREGWEVVVANRTFQRAADLGREVGAAAVPWEERSAAGFDAVVNGTSLGMHPRVEETPLGFAGRHEGTLAFDTVYTPERTRFLVEAEAAGAAIQGGREMFWRQAALQHAWWFGGEPPFDQMREIMSRAP